MHTPGLVVNDVPSMLWHLGPIVHKQINSVDTAFVQLIMFNLVIKVITQLAAKFKVHNPFLSFIVRAKIERYRITFVFVCRLVLGFRMVEVFLDFFIVWRVLPAENDFRWTNYETVYQSQMFAYRFFFILFFAGNSKLIHLLHNSEHPTSVFSILDTGTKHIPLVADSLFDLLILKMQPAYTSKKQTKVGKLERHPIDRTHLITKIQRTSTPKESCDLNEMQIKTSLDIERFWFKFHENFATLLRCITVSVESVSAWD